MTDQDNLSSILDRILAGDRTEADIAKLRQSLKVQGDVVQYVSQNGKFNTNIGRYEGDNLHIGDIYQGADADTLKQVFLEVLEIPNQKPPTALTGANGLGLLSDVPELPQKFLPRPDDLESLKAKVLGDSTQAVAVTGRAAKIGVHGMGGIGKSVLAAALAHDSEVRQGFPNGIVWVRLGNEKTNPIDEQIKVVRALTNEAQTFTTLHEGKVFLQNLLRDIACLLILDDVWYLEQVKVFEVLGPRCQMVITSRDAGIVGSFGADLHQLNVLRDEQALQLLADASEQEVATLPSVAKQVVDECGNLPLALAMVGAMAKGKPNLWNGLLKRLQDASLEKIKKAFPDYPYPDLLKAVQVSVEALEAETQTRYLDFAVFAEDTPIPLAVLQTFWEPEGLDELDVDELVSNFVDLALVRQDEAQRLTLHDLQLDYVRKQVGDNLPARHAALLDAYETQCPDGWHSGPQDGYFFERLPYHLKQAGKIAELQTLLLDYHWLQSKLDNTGVIPLISDYDLLSELQYFLLVQGAIILSSHILSRDPQQLPGQLLGRLLSQPEHEIQLLLEKVKQIVAFPWLRPISANLTPPNSSLLRTLEGHQDWITTVWLTRNNKQVVSASNDKTLKVWDLDLGRLLHTLEGHQDGINSIALISDSKRVVSASNDKTLKVWDLEQGQLLHTLEGHLDRVTAVAITSGSKRAVSASNDRTLKVWDLEQGQLLHTLEGHLDEIRSVAITSNDKQAISASNDKTLKVWDLEQGQLLHTLKGHQDWVTAVAITSDSKRAISAADDKTLKVWDLEQGQLLHTLKGHQDWVTAVAITPDSKRAISASNDKTLKVWEVEQGQLLHTLEGHQGGIKSVAITSNEKWAVSASFDRTLKVWNLDQGQLLYSLEGHQARVSSVALTADCKRAVSASFDKTLKIWNLDQSQPPQSLQSHKNRVKTIIISADSKQAISASDDRTLKIWSLEQGQLLNTLEGHQDWINFVALTADGKTAISASDDKTLKVWDLEQGCLLRTLEGHQDKVNSLVLTADGKTAISASDDKTLKVWDLIKGQLLQTLKGHQDRLNCVVLIADGKKAISVSEGDDKTVKIWDLGLGKCVSSFEGDGAYRCCALAPDNVTIVAGDWLGRVHFMRLQGWNNG